MYRLARLLISRPFSTHLEQVEAEVYQVLRNFDKVNPAKITRQSSFDELGLDSLDVMEVVVDLEEKLNVTLSDDEALRVLSVLDAITIFSKHKSK
jgi:acyl carrier protein